MKYLHVTQGQAIVLHRAVTSNGGASAIISAIEPLCGSWFVDHDPHAVDWTWEARNDIEIDPSWIEFLSSDSVREKIFWTPRDPDGDPFPYPSGDDRCPTVTTQELDLRKQLRKLAL